MRLSWLFAAIMISLVPSRVLAVSQTLWTKAYPLTRGGELAGCSIEFNAFTKDHIYRQGGLVGLAGSISLNLSEESKAIPVFVGLKLVIKDYEGEASTPNPPTQIHLVTSDGTVWKGDDSKSFLSDTPGGRTQMLLPDDTMVKAFADIGDTSTLTVAFNRRIGGTDIRVPIDLLVTDTEPQSGKPVRSSATLDVWRRCVLKVLGSIK